MSASVNQKMKVQIVWSTVRMAHVWSQVEASKECQTVLAARMAEGSLPSCTIIDDVVDYRPSGAALEAAALTAGFPCQAWSVHVK